MSAGPIKMKCHYEVMEIERTATIEEIRKQYKKLALKYHPDRNIGHEEEATEAFKLITSAYSVLSDPQERQWYDDHRESILRGGNGTKSDDDEDEYVVNLWRYFNSSCYNGFDEHTPNNFYQVYQSVFSSVWQQEHEDGFDPSVTEPLFGGPESSVNEVLRFYNYWSSFSSQLSFAWEDKYNQKDAPNRTVRRAIDKENQKYRDSAKKAYNNLVQSLVNYLKKRDPRMIAIQIETAKKISEDEMKLKARRDELIMKKKERKEMNRQKYENDEEEKNRREVERERAFLLADNSDDDDDDADNIDIDLEKSELRGPSESMGDLSLEPIDDEEDVTLYQCDICSKDFQTETQLNQHLNSKPHRKKAQEMEKKQRKTRSNDGHSSTSKATASDNEEDNQLSSTVTSSKISTASFHANSAVDPDEASEDISEATADLTSNDYSCRECGWRGDSRNKLFQHLKSTGHSIATTEPVKSNTSSAKKKQKKKIGLK